MSGTVWLLLEINTPLEFLRKILKMKDYCKSSLPYRIVSVAYLLVTVVIKLLVPTALLPYSMSVQNVLAMDNLALSSFCFSNVFFACLILFEACKSVQSIRKTFSSSYNKTYSDCEEIVSCSEGTNCITNNLHQTKSKNERELWNKSRFSNLPLGPSLINNMLYAYECDKQSSHLESIPEVPENIKDSAFVDIDLNNDCTA